VITTFEYKLPAACTKGIVNVKPLNESLAALLALFAFAIFIDKIMKIMK
jgi:hypothetical protein